MSPDPLPILGYLKTAISQVVKWHILQLNLPTVSMNCEAKCVGQKITLPRPV